MIIYGRAKPDWPSVITANSLSPFIMKTSSLITSTNQSSMTFITKRKTNKLEDKQHLLLHASCSGATGHRTLCLLRCNLTSDLRCASLKELALFIIIYELNSSREAVFLNSQSTHNRHAINTQSGRECSQTICTSVPLTCKFNNGTCMPSTWQTRCYHKLTLGDFSLSADTNKDDAFYLTLTLYVFGQ